MLNLFDESNIDQDITVIRCSTQWEADTFIDYLCAKGVLHDRQAASLKEQWEKHNIHTCYHISQPRWCNDQWYAINYPHYNIIDFCDIYRGSQADTTISYSYEELFAQG